MNMTDPAQSLFQAAQRVVDEHGWPEVTRSLAHAARDAGAGLRPERSDSALAPVFEVVKQLPQSAWTPTASSAR